MTRRRRLLVGAVAPIAVLAGACGSEEGDAGGDAPTPDASVPAEASSWEVPKVDPASKAEADALHTEILTTLLSEPFTYEGSTAAMVGQVSFSGASDPLRSRSEVTMTWSGIDGLAETSGGVDEFAMSSRNVDRRSYAYVDIPQAKGCWWDFGKLTSPLGDLGWVPPAALVVDGYAEGFAKDDDDVIVINADAVNLVAAVYSKLARVMYVAEEVPAPVVLTVEDGELVSAEYEVGAAIDALVAAGATLPEALPSGEEERLGAVMGGIVTIEFDVGRAQRIVAPPPSHRMDASAVGQLDLTAVAQMTAEEREALLPGIELEPCSAAASADEAP